MDSVRTALRQSPGARVTVVYRRSSEEMPAHPEEVRLAEEEGTRFRPRGAGPGHRDRARQGVAVQSMELGAPDASGRRRPCRSRTARPPCPATPSSSRSDCTGGEAPFRDARPGRRGSASRRPRDARDLASAGLRRRGRRRPGPTMIVDAIGQGKRAAFHIDRFLQRTVPTLSLRFDERLPMADRAAVVRNTRAHAPSVLPLPDRPSVPRGSRSFAEFEHAPTEEEARYSATRCLDCGICSECRECVAACPPRHRPRACGHRRRPSPLAWSRSRPGFRPVRRPSEAAARVLRFPNVITGRQMDRILAPTRPFNAVVRPSDGKVPTNVAFVLCTGSRDYQVGNRLCSRVCCMYSMKQAQLLMGALPLADVTIYYIDIRAFGKGYEEFFQQTKGMSVHFIQGARSPGSRRPTTSDLDRPLRGYRGRRRAQDGPPRPGRARRRTPSQPGSVPALREREPREGRGPVRAGIDEELEPGETNLPGCLRHRLRDRGPRHSRYDRALRGGGRADRRLPEARRRRAHDGPTSHRRRSSASAEGTSPTSSTRRRSEQRSRSRGTSPRASSRCSPARTPRSRTRSG